MQTRAPIRPRLAPCLWSFQARHDPRHSGEVHRWLILGGERARALRPPSQNGGGESDSVQVLRMALPKQVCADLGPAHRSYYIGNLPRRGAIIGGVGCVEVGSV